MPNQFYVPPPNISGGLDALMGGVKSAQLNSARQQAVQAMQSGDTRGALARLMSIGDTQGAQALASFGNNERNFAFQQQQADRQQSNQDRQFGLQQQTANTAQIQTVKDANGNEQLVRIDRQGNATPINPTGLAQQPGNPYASGKFTEVQGKSATFADRMSNSHKTINDLENINDGVSGYLGGSITKGPLADSTIVNTMISPERQKSLQAQRDFVNAILRRESGAAISDGEFKNARQQYFPQPGDSKEVIEQKRNNRVAAIEGNMREAGPAYRPPQGWTGAGSQGRPQQQSAQQTDRPRQPASSVPPAAVAALKQDPTRRDQFDAKYGAGASARILGQ